MVETIRTERLVLREWAEGDWGAQHAFASDPEVVRFMPFGPQTEEQCKYWLAAVLDYQRDKFRTHFDFAVTLTSTGQVIGGCDLVLRLAEGRNDAEMGYIYHRSAWGNGYATEAARALVRFAFEQLKVHRVYATCDVDNPASARVLEKLGMRREGLLKSSFLSHTGWRDHYLYAVVEGERAL